MNIRFAGVMISSAFMALVALTLPDPDTSRGNFLLYSSDTRSEVVIRIDFNSLDVNSGFFCNNSADTPEMCGAAKLVPLEML